MMLCPHEQILELQKDQEIRTYLLQVQKVPNKVLRGVRLKKIYLRKSLQQR